MDENTPPLTMIQTQDPKKLLGGSPSIRNVLSPSNKVNILQSNDNGSIKKSLPSIVDVSKSPVCTQQAVCRYAISPEDAEQWAERVSAITDNDHRDYIAFAAEVIHDIIKSLPVLQEVVQADSDDDEIQFQPRTTIPDENTEPSQDQETSKTPTKTLPTNLPATALSPSQFKDVENIFQIDDDSVLSSMTKRLGSPCEGSPLKGLDDQEVASQPQSEHVDPFKSKPEIPNSPATASVAAMNELEEILDFDPFSTKSSVMNSPVKNPEDALKQAVGEACKVAEVEGSLEDELPDCLEDADTFSSKPDISEGNITVIENLPEDASGLEYMVPNSETSLDEAQQAKPEDKPSDESETDPFKPKTQISNTPEKKVETEQAGYGLPANLDDVDPFKTTSQVCNSPEQSVETNKPALPERLDESDPFKSKSQISNSPQKPAKSLQTEESLPENLDNVDPFKPKSQIVNSPVKPETEETTGLPETEETTGLPETEETTGLPETEETTGLPESFDEVDPFRTKSQVCNSPLTAETVKMPENLDEMDPFKPKQQMMNSPVKPTDSPQKAKAVELPENLDDIDPFMPKQQMVNSPVKPTDTLELPDNLDEIDPFKPKTQMINSPVKSNDEPTEMPKPVDLPDNLDDIDPFKPKTQMMNSPVTSNEQKETTKPVDLPDNLEEIDPFKPKTQMMNSPIKSNEQKQRTKPVDLPNNLDDIDPFKPKTQMMNSPIKSNEQKETTKPVDLPNNLDDIDPFKPKTQMMNSPIKSNEQKQRTKPVDLPNNLDDIDPFKPKTQMMNSPIKSNEQKETTKPVDLPNNLDDIDPFKPKTQMMNSPIKSNEQKETTKSVDLPNNLDDIDPFKPKTQMMNSPIKSNEQKETTKPVDLPDNLDDIDPFKPKTQMMNSPVTSNVQKETTKPVDLLDNLDDIDPFKPKTQMMNSPVTSNVQKEMPKPVDLPNNLDDIDPFKPKTQMMNFPVTSGAQEQVNNHIIPDNFDCIDPFKSKTQIKNSPSAKTETADKQNTQQLSVDPFDNLDAFNPFQGMGKTNITPNKNNNIDLLMGFGETPKTGGGIDLGNNLMCMIAPDKKTQEDMALADAEFRPANEVFSDPNVWDMLEKFGSSNNQKEESELARMSLYVKFDPLVDSSPGFGKQQAASARCLQRMEVVRDGDESIMLMGTPPKSGGRRRSILVQRRPPMSVSSIIYEEETDKKPTKPHIVDLMLCCEDEVLKADQDQKPPSQNLDEFSEVVEVLKYSETDLKKLLETQKKQLTMEFQGRHLAMEQKFTTELQDQKHKYSTELQGQKETKSRLKDMMQVVSEYEKLINELITARETKETESKDVIAKLKSERDQVQNDLNDLENCFSDLLKRFEKAKGMLAGFKTNEETLKAFSQEQTTKLKAKEETIAKLKSQAETKLKQILEAKEKEKTVLSAEILKLQSAQKRSELKIDGLERELDQKRKENVELTDLCDTLIAKVGGS